MAPDFAARSLALLLAKSSWLNLREAVKNVYFAVIALAGVLALAVSAIDMGEIFGTKTYPVTYMMLELIRDVYSLFVLVVTTLYAGEMVWREREARMGQMMDALPVPSCWTSGESTARPLQDCSSICISPDSSLRMSARVP